jgi:hypothetical protein
MSGLFVLREGSLDANSRVLQRGRPSPAGLAVWRGLALACLVGVAFHGRHIAAEASIRDAAYRLAVCVPDQARPYVSSNRSMSSSPR